MIQLGVILNEVAPETIFLIMSTKYGDTSVQRFVNGANVGALDELMDRVEADYRYKETLSTWAGQGVFLADS